MIARQTYLPKLSVLFVNTDRLFNLLGEKEGAEVLKKNVQELDELLASYEMKIPTKEFYFGEQGLKDLITEPTATLIRPKTPPMAATNGIDAYIYNLSTPEGGVMLASSSKVTLWVSGQTVQAKILNEKDVLPGELVDLILVLDHPVRTIEGERMFLQVNGKLASLGVVTNIH
ncbi:hypothetical protein H9Q10_11090 [Eikenella sp. S3360]|uniref:Uncharacterized protein n=1 Tax=Eikenella glucosivorans TaxID=2766967 RepID=A0ABS0ND08_9NEIS|nr:hypothetical protein [Eikenella glucosivorans]MBH5330208.1 hypothetical protein [Eikenella glucosivorans]